MINGITFFKVSDQGCNLVGAGTMKELGQRRGENEIEFNSTNNESIV